MVEWKQTVRGDFFRMVVISALAPPGGEKKTPMLTADVIS